MTFTAPTIAVKWSKARRREGQQRVLRVKMATGSADRPARRAVVQN